MNPSEVLSMQTPEKQPGSVELTLKKPSYEYFLTDFGNVAFLNGSVRNPDTSKMPLLQLETEEEIERLIVAIEPKLYDAFDKEGTLDDMVYSGLAYRLAELNYLKTLIRLNKHAGSNSEDSKELAESAKQANIHGFELYGETNRQLFEKCLHDRISKIGDAQIPKLQTIMTELQGMIGLRTQTRPESAEASNDIFSLSDSDVARLNSFVQSDFEKHFEVIDDKEKYDVEQIVDIFKRAVDAEGEGFKGVEVVVAEHAANISADGKDKLFKVGANLKPQTGSWVKGMMVHEFFHMRRSLYAPQIGDDFIDTQLRHGQDTYGTFEDGLAVNLEDVTRGKIKLHGERYLLAIGLAQGIDMHSPRDFREVFEALWRLELLSEIKGESFSDEDLDVKIERKRSVVFNSVVRVFRGTPCHLPGVVYPKDFVYSEGPASSVPYLSNIETYEQYQNVFRTGKLDLSDPRHLRYKHAVENILHETHHEA